MTAGAELAANRERFAISIFALEFNESLFFSFTVGITFIRQTSRIVNQSRATCSVNTLIYA